MDTTSTAPTDGHVASASLGRIKLERIRPEESGAATGVSSAMSATISRSASTAPTFVANNGFPAANSIFDRAGRVFDRLAQLPPDCDSYAIGHVTLANFRSLEAERDRRGRKVRFLFDKDAELVIVTIPTLSHETMHAQLMAAIHQEIVGMHLHREWALLAATTYLSASGSGSSGEGDSSGLPKSRAGTSTWPTLVIEAGYSQTLASLRAKANWWFPASGHLMKVVLLVKCVRQESRIDIEKWVERPAQQRLGATTTRHFAQVGPICHQSLSVVWAGPLPIADAPVVDRENEAMYRVVGGPLTIAFEDLFLRPPVGIEHDLVVPDIELRDMAAFLWATVYRQ